ncbi:uncharacterized protein LOC144715020 [Wolffia australiana]
MIRRQPPSRLSPSTSAVLFHSSSVLDRRRGGHWNPKHNVYTRRLRRMHEKQTLLRNVSQYAEHLFQSWRHRDDPDASPRSSWYEQEYWAKAFTRRQKSQWDTYRSPRKGCVQFCFSDDDDDDNRTEFWSSSFGGRHGFYWSFCDRENLRWSQYESRRDSSNWKFKSEEEEEEGDEPPRQLNLAAERKALGLSSSGPLKLADVKEAFRTCALRWHPDRHHGSSKTEAEEKFKSCLAAYQSLRETLAAS